VRIHIVIIVIARPLVQRVDTPVEFAIHRHSFATATQLICIKPLHCIVLYYYRLVNVLRGAVICACLRKGLTISGCGSTIVEIKFHRLIIKVIAAIPGF
jgi:hypothetical protein